MAMKQLLLAAFCISKLLIAGSIPVGVECPQPGEPGEHMELHQQCKDRQIQDCIATFSCTSGYRYIGTSTITCQLDGKWTDEVGSCEAIICPKLIPPKNGRIVQPDRSYHKNATTECEDGYVLDDPSAATRWCRDDNTWEGKQAKCIAKQCPSLKKVENGKLSGFNGSYGETINIVCDHGYKLDGLRVVTCNASGLWDGKFGQCAYEKDSTMIMLPITMAVVGCIIVGIAVYFTWKKFFKGSCQPQASTEEQLSVKHKCTFYFTFLFKSENLEATSTEDTEAHPIQCHLKDSIESAMRKVNIKATVDILYLCWSSERGFFSIGTNFADEKRLIDVISHIKVYLASDQPTEIVSSSIKTMDKVQYALSAQILQDKHVKDRSLDESINLNTQYVKLKLHSQKTMGTMKRAEIERPDHYQDSLKESDGTGIEDEDLIKSNNIEKYVLLHGRAGIGKSTLMQRLLWKWANGEWATQFKAIFLFNLRYLMTLTKKVDFAHMINTYSVYNTGRHDFVVDKPWLGSHEKEIAFVLDGVDEVHNFKQLWNEIQEGTATRQPINWCFALLQRQQFSKSTVIASSRPFADLCCIGKTLKEKGLYQSLQLVQLMGLTCDRVEEFVMKNVSEGSQKFVLQTLKRNPILMSISSITFYCAALCKILSDQTEPLTGLNTYTQITAYIMDRFIQRSMQKAEERFDMMDVLQTLSKLAYNGLVREIGKGPLRLVFEAKDFSELSMEKNVTSIMMKTGLLVQTEILDPDDRESSTVLTQFVHLMIQEFLAMAGLLSQPPAEFRQQLKRLSGTQQFSMATLFLYGLAFNRENEMLKTLDLSGSSEQEMLEKQEALKDLAQNMPNKLQALQVAHESQSPDVARAVGETTFKDGCQIENMKLTIIDVMALTFVLKHNPDIHKIRLARCEVDAVSLTEIVKFLDTEKSLEDVGFLDDTLNDHCVQELMKTIANSRSIRTLELSSASMTDEGVSSIADALKSNTSLRILDLSSNVVTNEGLMQIAEALSNQTQESNQTLQSLRLMFRGITDDGLRHLMTSLEENTTLKELWLIEPDISDDGIAAIGSLLNSSITSLRIDCRSMTDWGMQWLAEGLVKKKLLESLWIYSTNITDKGVVHLMDKIREHDSLTEVTLYGLHMRKDAANAVLNTVSVDSLLSVRMWEPNVDGHTMEKIRNNQGIILQ